MRFFTAITLASFLIATPSTRAEIPASDRPIESLLLLRAFCLKDAASHAACRPQKSKLLGLRDRLCSAGPAEFCSSLVDKSPSERFKVVNTRDCEGVFNVFDFEEFSPNSYNDDRLGYDIAMRALGCKQQAPTSAGRVFRCGKLDAIARDALSTGGAKVTEVGGVHQVVVGAQMIPGFKPTAPLEPVDSVTRQVFARVAMLTPNESPDTYRSFVKETFTPERVAALESSFAVARDALLKFLDSLEPKPPAAVRARVSQARVLLPATDMKRIEQSCYQGLGPAGEANASYDPLAGVMTVCPAALLALEYANPRALVSLLLHELGHAIDPCTQAISAIDLKASCAANLAATTKAAAANTFLPKMSSLAACLADKSDLGDGAGRQILANTTADEIADFAKKFPSVAMPEEARCFASLYGSTGPLRHCNASREERTKMSDLMSKLSDSLGYASPEAQAAVQLYSRTVAQTDRSTGVGEAVSDYLAGRALSHALSDERYLGGALAAMTEEDRVSEALTAGLGTFCLAGKAPPGLPHPTAQLRASLVASGGIRQHLGCKPLAASGPGYPSAACRLEGEKK